jgi:hypothetical protein
MPFSHETRQRARDDYHFIGRFKLCIQRFVYFKTDHSRQLVLLATEPDRGFIDRNVNPGRRRWRAVDWLSVPSYEQILVSVWHQKILFFNYIRNRYYDC